MSKCVYPGCSKVKNHGHHVTYNPPVIVGLCLAHHEDITIVNTNATEHTRRKLTNAQRWTLWQKWLSGEIKPVRTANALAWISRWGRRRARKPRRKFAKSTGPKIWGGRAWNMTEEMFNDGLTHGEARVVTDNARKYLLSQLYNNDYNEALDLAVQLLGDANFATALRGPMAKACQINLEEAWPFWKLGEIKYPWSFDMSGND